MASEVRDVTSGVTGCVTTGATALARGAMMSAVGDATGELTVDKANDRLCRAAGDAALEVEVALGELAAGIRLAKAEVRRMRASAAGWAARGAWGSGHPSIPRSR